MISVFGYWDGTVSTVERPGVTVTGSRTVVPDASEKGRAQKISSRHDQFRPCVVYRWRNLKSDKPGRNILLIWLPEH
jgi:hypothetical protein